MKKQILHTTLILLLSVLIIPIASGQTDLQINDAGYFSSDAVQVFIFSDPYFEGHQGGINIIQHGNRVAANGDLNIETTLGQWKPFSQLDNSVADKQENTITLSLSYPNKEAKNRQFNPINYPNLELQYTIRIKAEGNAFRIIVDLEKSLPKQLLGKASFNLELYPGDLFGKSYRMNETTGIFPRQVNGPFYTGDYNTCDALPLATGNRLTIAPETKKQRMSIESFTGPLELVDGRSLHNNGWFIVRTMIPKGATKNAIEWLITPNAVKDWKYGPVIHINEVGYLPLQPKAALLECDLRDTLPLTTSLIRILPSGENEIVLEDLPESKGVYGHFRYFSFDFTSVTEPGIYYITCENNHSENFRIGEDVYSRNVWQPTLEYYLPVQMCHMRVNDRYKVWHGLCHMDDARMAPVDHIHFDGYMQGPSTLTRFNPLDPVPGLNAGGWHDAGDYDLRVESQGGTVYALSLIWEAFRPEYDVTDINQKEHLVEMHRPDGKPDILQQIEHGTISIVNGYHMLGRLFRGIICSDLRQYVLLGDGSVMTDNVVYTGKKEKGIPDWFGQQNDDRWVFTEINPKRELKVCAYLAAASRTLKGFNDTLSQQSLEIAEILWQKNSESEFDREKILALVELILTTEKPEYSEQLLAMKSEVARLVPETGWSVARIATRIEDPFFQRGYLLGIQNYYSNLQQETSENPFGVPFSPRTWGSAWGIEKFGVEQYYLYTLLKIEVARQYMLNALNYVLGVHPGENTSSFVSGVGTKSATIAYGINRDEWSSIPGGVVSGTAYIKPDFPEFKEWPYLWQQTEYVMGGAASNFMFLVLGAEEVAEE